jgi:hypothetical protein
MGLILCSRGLPKSSLSNLFNRVSLSSVTEMKRWVLSTAGQNPQFQNCFSQEVCNSVEVQKWVLSAAVEIFLKVACLI